MRNQILPYILLLLLCMGLSLFAGNYTSSVSNVSIVKTGDQVQISFVVHHIRLSSNKSVTLTPVLFDGNNNWKNLEPLTLTGRKRRAYDKYAQSSSEGQTKYHVVKGRRDAVTYTTTLPYESWMAYVSLAVVEKWRGCCSAQELPLRVVSKPHLLYYDIKPYFDNQSMTYELTELEKYDIDNAFLHPMEEYDKRYEVLVKDRGKSTGTIIFKVGKSDIDMTYADNVKVMGRFKEAFHVIERDSLAKLRKIVIAAYASPEGSLALNTRLAGDRAMAVQKYFLSFMQNPDPRLFELINGREDWDGLREQVAQSAMPEKSEVLQIIDAYTMTQEIRKQKLKALNGGVPYKVMLNNFYPSLRNGGYLQIFYEVERKVSTLTRDKDGREVWVDPDSPRNRCVTAVNKALPLILNQNYQEALPLVLQYKDDARAWNYIGVTYMMMGDYQHAIPYLQKAKDAGDIYAGQNLEQINFILSNS